MRSGVDVMAKPLNLGIIGAGRVSSEHAAAFATRGVTIRRVADVRIEAAEDLASRYSAVPGTDHHELLRDPMIDAVAILVPHDLHAPIANEALENGKHVFMDKPLATSLDDAENLCRRHEAGSSIFMICHNVIFHPVVLRAQRYIEAGVLGRPTVSDAWSYGWLDMPPWDFRLRRKATGGGAWIDGVPHLIYALEFLLGAIERVEKVATSGASRMEAEDASVGTLRFEAGHVATVRVSYADRVPGHDQGWPAAWNMGFDLHGTGGQIRAELAPKARLSIYEGEGDTAVIDFDDDFSSSFQGAVDEFLSAVEQGRQPSVTPRESLRTLAHVLDA